MSDNPKYFSTRRETIKLLKTVFRDREWEFTMCDDHRNMQFILGNKEYNTTNMLPGDLLEVLVLALQW